MIEIELGTADAATEWDEVLDLLHRAFAVMEGRIDPPSSLHDLDEMSLAQKAAYEICLLAHADEELVGCVFCRADEDALHISKLAVDPDHQGGGIARALVDLAAAEAGRLGLDTLRLQTRVEMTENHVTFTRLGFRTVGQTAHPGYDRPTSITMERAL